MLLSATVLISFQMPRNISKKASQIRRVKADNTALQSSQQGSKVTLDA